MESNVTTSAGVLFRQDESMSYRFMHRQSGLSMEYGCSESMIQCMQSLSVVDTHITFSFFKNVKIGKFFHAKI